MKSGAIFKSNQYLIYLIITLLFIFSMRSISKAQVLINEVQASNTKTIVHDLGKYDDWIELYNAGSSPVNLNGYGLSDDMSRKYLFTFPEVSLDPGAFLVVMASDTIKTFAGTQWQTAVKESDLWSYRVNTSAPPDTNWRNLSFNSNWQTGPGGIGFGDGDDATIVSTCISIYMRRTFSISDTSKILSAILNMDYDDGFVAYLNGVEIARVNVGIPGKRPAWNDPAPHATEAKMYRGERIDSFYIHPAFLKSIIKNGTNVLAIETHNQNATSNDLSSRPWLSFEVAGGQSMFGPTPSWFRSPATQYYHAPFKISRSGENIFLTDPTGNVVDQVHTGFLESDHSKYRNPDGGNTWCMTDSPSPNRTNNSSSCQNGYAPAPEFSKAGGFYSGTQQISISTNISGAQIRYTNDGSDVKENSTLYTGPIQIDTTQTIRAAVFNGSTLRGPMITHTYFINSSLRMPVFSITTDPVNLWDYNTGIFVKGPNASANNPFWGANFWQDWEKPISVEYYDRSKQLVFSFNSAMKITGGWSRSAPQKSLEIMLSDKYGLSKLNHALEPSIKPYITKWDNFLLHTTGNDRSHCKMRDPLMNRLLKGTHNDFIAYEPCLVYINGQNWGVYYVRENDDHHWIEGNYGYKKDEIDLLKESYFYPGIEVKKGSNEMFFSMYEYATTTSPSDTGFFNVMDSYMDLKNMTDYFIAETYYPNDDWMGGSNNNLKLWRPKKDGGKFRYLIYDLDFGLGYSGTASKNMLSIARNATPHNHSSQIFKALTNNAKYRQYFINRYADLMNTIFLPSNISAMVGLFRDTLKHDMNLQFKQWGGDSATWISKINSMLDFAAQRPANARNIIQSEFGLGGQVTLTLNVYPAGAGRIEISTITPESYPWNGIYFNGNPVTITAIPNPGYTFNYWQSNSVIAQKNYNGSVTYNFNVSDVINCYFTGNASALNLHVSELNYNSHDTLNSGDWIEFHNAASYTLDLSGWKFRDSQDNHIYTIPTGTKVLPSGYIVLASDMQKFRSRFPSINSVYGNFGFDFSNGGEMLRLFNHADSLIISFTYSDQSPWPLTADGVGYTLERTNFTSDHNSPSTWFAGCIEGSPGRGYTPPVAALSHNGLSSICAGDTLTILATTSAGNTVQWYRNSAEINGAQGISYVSSESGYYKVKVTGRGCYAFSDSLQVIVNPVNEITSVIGSSRCGSGELTLMAQGTSAPEWYADNSLNTLLGSGNTFTTPILSSTTVYYVRASGQCSGAAVTLTAEIKSVSADPIASDTERCGPGNVTLQANSSETLKWYSTLNDTLVLASGNSFSVNGLVSTATYFVQAGSDCPSQRIPVTAVILPVNASPAVQDNFHCGAGEVILTANDTAQVIWYDQLVGGNILSTGNVFKTPVLNQSTSYFAESSGRCPSARVEVHASILNYSADPVVAHARRCGPGSLTLTASSPESLQWYDLPNGNVISNGSNLIIQNLSADSIFYVRAGDVCPGNFVQVHARIHPLPMPSLGNDTVIVSGNTMMLSPGSGYSNYLWSDGSTGISINISASGIYHVTVSNREGCQATDSIEVSFATFAETLSSSSATLLIYPNPASSSFVIYNPAVKESGTVSVHDMSGKLVTAQQVTGLFRPVHVNVQELSSGIYNVSFISDKRQTREKLIVR
ncbi:MAG: T9SS C-terminal target domain-containing protein [Bacteroidetes bacterium]|nr:MAG: T9SS C-terminal target domain-containing protein [Bacteroidota bacterium]REK04808.1 MAG: T9SS C-terminal target domain-containing protein [Bacteroidota bacterium]REK36281.1 MAG: T9SS C-terminal target domain-containing protein [Bacteroidota bacterium]REK51055.1 MAG: T9SS C-terminal target domain-containing protein [Bacteroidota bacterium]